MSTLPIELVYFTGCPHVDAARAALQAALETAGLPARWREWDQTLPETPAHLQGYGSPTVLVGGRDVTGKALLNAGRACRADGIPSSEAIAAALAAWRTR
jgi:mercuric ion transport protein